MGLEEEFSAFSRLGSLVTTRFKFKKNDLNKNLCNFFSLLSVPGNVFIPQSFHVLFCVLLLGELMEFTL